MGTEPDIPRGWNLSRVSLLTGRRYLITGGTSGLGRASAKGLMSLGAHVTVTARNVAKGEAMVAAREANDVLDMDLGNLSSVRAAAARVSVPYDVVILNAGIMWTPYALTVDGFESQLGVNHLGHFAFAGLLRDRIQERLVTVSSLYQRYGSFGDGSVDEIRARCWGEVPYSPRDAYGDSKLANMLFTHEVERRRTSSGPQFIAVAAHPGWSSTNLFGAGRGVAGAITTLASRILAQGASRGALPQLCAATLPGLRGGEYFGPRGPGELRGAPEIVQPVDRAFDAERAANLWRVSEELTGVEWE